MQSAGLKVLGFYGGNLGDPHKQSAIPLLDRITETATAINAVNLFYSEGDALVGDNIEGKGVLSAISKQLDPSSKRVVILGAGKLARAVALELAAISAAEITVVNRTETRLNELVTMIGAKHQTPISAVLWARRLCRAGGIGYADKRHVVLAT